ncbi:MAG TPA: hypothetical protein VHY34_08900 [Caulobacteraceae bacterium]|jgi:hypothetical protein|nr:hypothetical protein [Caulobacteraceae bacterium]
MMGTSRAFEALDCYELISGQGACVVILTAVGSDFDQIEDTKKDRLIRVMELWCAGTKLTPEQFNGNEGRAKKGGVNVLVGAFKTHKMRLYGAAMTIDQRRTFVIVDSDLAKKQNKADPTILKRAKGRAIDVVEKLTALAK